ncbi:hypothetical protein RH831_08810 [Halodesulfurarchaeum sp. HSR-GB]|uniref:hypothetical protein n=1 Tax=Halodesulfurarchaeum sp. HSR-GB TaxID=3074077 RepID=UPI00285423D6|nr:hypothetical protein [Halodesulfurarchaeum sp. HSR-GB]MDR5657279.1 hypothetical protein [Halodesulfurarchaeum sp. HSR-GB]
MSSQQTSFDRFAESPEETSETDAEPDEPEPEPEDSRPFDGEERGRIKHHAKHDNLPSLLRSAGLPDMLARDLIEKYQWETAADVFDSIARPTSLAGVGSARAEKLRSARTLIGEALQDNQNDEPEDWGPTMNEPLPEPELGALFESGGELVDRREIPDSGLSLSDITDWSSHKREQDREDRIEEWAEKAAAADPRGVENTHPDAGAEEQAVATDGGETIETAKEPGEYEAGDTVLVIEDVAIGRMTAPNILEAEVSSSGKSVMIPEDSDSIHGRRRLDAETIFSGESEYRDSTGYEIYTPGRYRSTQSSNYAPGPQSGANEKSDIGDLPEPTHWPDADEPDDAPAVCPACGEPGRWYDVGKPRCERCGETVDPDAEAEENDEIPDKWDLSRLDTGDTLIIEGRSGEFVVTRVHYFRGTHTVNRLEVAKREGGTWRSYRIEKLTSTEGPRLKIEREGTERSIMVNVNDSDHARDFEKTGHDEEKRRRYIRDTRDL